MRRTPQGRKEVTPLFHPAFGRRVLEKEWRHVGTGSKIVWDFALTKPCSTIEWGWK